MTGTPYEKWFTPEEHTRYREVVTKWRGGMPHQLARPEMGRLKWLVETDMSLVEMAREVGATEKCVWEALGRMGLVKTLPHTPTPRLGGPTYMAHDWYMGRKDRRIWV